jgi:hypothetical protein
LERIGANPFKGGKEPDWSSIESTINNFLKKEDLRRVYTTFEEAALETEDTAHHVAEAISYSLENHR